MTYAYWCVLIAIIMPYVFTITAKAGARNFDNNNPRAFLENLQGWRRRAHWAQQNAFEAFAPFGVAVIIAHQHLVAQDLLNKIAISFVICRLLHGIFYISDKSCLRSLSWLGGMICVVSLFILSSL
ncbi:MAG: hypothetical protein HOI53_03795 [Francisellaceae bacterium]|jgi:uncharacterized MAPEG superfamily protein|nr:hypothetical protein [Francisellaceae bacterium]MBT6207125.1 hypothetical protein [Francisellaceae bacterium]MBT6539648.1 hypothetical protein [Francisellaceae bacterium]